MEYRELTSLLDKNLYRIKTIGMHHEKIKELKRLLNGGGGQSGMDFAVEATKTTRIVRGEEYDDKSAEV
ncbi:hypothetical protein J41TS12_45300 [Paenibacillus antibioticophila]|uniref:Uncharacterized protein n=1 Tax=Paenibacillus antibioticophila TaxID=1274374 RepID=A0A920CJP7_9BACL|nr:hypothetical protein [Paenibacillus antibioticophila]GIO39669.1 hypothetical protein J41TS12_45300 [Paenibacillus antibioticophila]